MDDPHARLRAPNGAAQRQAIPCIATRIRESSGHEPDVCTSPLNVLQCYLQPVEPRHQFVLKADDVPARLRMYLRL